MRLTYCTHCARPTYVEDNEWTGDVQCDAPGCGKVFRHVQRRPVETYGPAGPPPLIDLDPPNFGPLPRLTGRHRCQVCSRHDTSSNAYLPGAFGRRRWVAEHKNPSMPEPCRTDVYAAIYKCPLCLRLLETPAYQWGTEVTCPYEQCQKSFVAPRDDVLHRHAGDAREGLAFVFTCPACRRHLRADTLRNGQSTFGSLVVCIHPECRHRIEVPPIGRQATPSPSLPGPVETAQAAVTRRRCLNCGLMVPANLITCPVCKFRDETAFV
jgi:hypothetical protein